MNKKFAALVVATLILTAVAPVQGQAPSKIPKIGFLGVRPDDSKSTFDLFRRQLQAIGYVDGKNIIFEYRNAENKPDRLPALVYRFNEIYLITRTELQTFSNDALLAPR